jgi:hypothetical protein
MRATASYRIRVVAGSRMKVCGNCGHSNDPRVLVCRGWKDMRRCGRNLRRAPKKAKPIRGSMERVALELKHAQKMGDEWSRKVTAAVGRMHYWTKRERLLAARLQAGPQPPKPKKPKPPRRRVLVSSGRAAIAELGESR